MLCLITETCLKTVITQRRKYILPDEELCARNHRYLGLLVRPLWVWRVQGSLESSLSVLFYRTHLRRKCTT